MAAAKSAKKPAVAKKKPAAAAAVPVEKQVQEALAWLKRHGTKARRDGMARYGIPLGNAYGVTMPDIQKLGKQFGKNHELALALWETGQYEARLLCAYVDDPAAVAPTQMDRWARDFDSWAVCDTICFSLFDRTPHAWKKVEQWAGKRDEFVKRAAFAMLASLTIHDRDADPALFLRGLELVEREAGDARNFVSKAINWALRSIGKKRDPVFKKAAVAVAERLAASPDAARRWVGKDALRDIAKAAARTKAG
ncbi:DNA alkylation repair protein [Luteimonas gilva]|uniref:DNA alkylation repair protein n=1 Tax=Luteimonas gilva TaxID=2572684 RepID=A0A4U5JMC9_9GAMM|nr:DNA alkylation repair protein [Luteimonas gilva]TKR30704.1 DNA alkylation repair protein [Luteimonas gilva]